MVCQIADIGMRLLGTGNISTFHLVRAFCQKSPLKYDHNERQNEHVLV